VQTVKVALIAVAALFAGLGVTTWRAFESDGVDTFTAAERSARFVARPVPGAGEDE